MNGFERRRFLQLASAGATGVLGANRPARAVLGRVLGSSREAPRPDTGRREVASVCWQCVTRCPIVGTLEEGRLVKIAGNPESARTRGKLCARGQAGLQQVDHPDRLLHPMKRVGRRGEGKWERIPWDEALDLLVEGGEIAGRRVPGLRGLRDAGTPEKFLFHYGRTVGSDATILFSHFLPAYGTGTIGDHNSICMAAGGVAYGLTRGRRFRDFTRARIILNFGAGLLDAYTDHLPHAQRTVDAVARGAKLYTFDVRLSNTAAKSTEWIPVQPATDLAVVLSMSHVLMEEGLYDGEAITEHSNVTPAELHEHLKSYTPEWAEAISGVPAERITALAREFGETKPGICVSFRGAFMHHNGVQAQRAIFMLQTIAGNVDVEGTAPPTPRWEWAFPTPEGEPKTLDILQGAKGAYVRPDYNVSHQILPMIDAGPERPDIYLFYCHNPVYANGDCRANERVFRDEEKIPFLVSVDVAMSESTRLADLVLPDATYLERWCLDGRGSPEGIPEYMLQQPMHAPRGEARNFCDVACEIAERIGVGLGFGSAEEFVRAACENTPVVRDVGGFEYMREHGLFADTAAEPRILGPAKADLRSDVLAEHGFDDIPAWVAPPGHENLSDDELVLTTFKVPVQTHSRTQGCKWLTELYHDNPAWIHPDTAARFGIANGDRIVVRSEVGEIETTARVTEGVHPKAVAISHHCGHWEWGTYASGRAGPDHADEFDGRKMWWTTHGTHPNFIIPNRGDPIAGSMCWNDTVVTLARA